MTDDKVVETLVEQQIAFTRAYNNFKSDSGNKTILNQHLCNIALLTERFINLSLEKRFQLIEERHQKESTRQSVAVLSQALKPPESITQPKAK